MAEHRGIDSLPRERYVMGNSCSLNEILTMFSEFCYDNEGKLVICSVCSPSKQKLPKQRLQSKFATFNFDLLESPIEAEGAMSKKFRNLKAHLCAQLKSASHVKEVKVSEIADVDFEKFDRRERLVGKRIGRI